MEILSYLHIQGPELALSRMDAVGIMVDSLQMLQHVSRVLVLAIAFVSESGCDMLASFSIAEAGHVRDS